MSQRCRVLGSLMVFATPRSGRIGHDPAVAESPDAVQVGDQLHPVAHHTWVGRVVVGINTHVMIAAKPGRRRPGPPAPPAAGPASPPWRRRSAQVGAQPNARRRRVLTAASQPRSWELKSSGPAKRPAAQPWWRRRSRPLAHTKRPAAAAAAVSFCGEKLGGASASRSAALPFEPHKRVEHDRRLGRVSQRGRV